MKIETRYSLGDVVVNIHNKRRKKWAPCGFCESTGNITGRDGTNRDCPECYGDKGDYRWLNETWAIEEEDIMIRLIEYRYTEEEIREIYMASTGGGRIYRVENLYPTDEEAQAECDKRNKSLEEKSNE